MKDELTDGQLDRRWRWIEDVSMGKDGRWNGLMDDMDE